ncbi:hypothetical protein ACVWWK_002187 [Bradyrhizobium sp. LB9.1b]
MTPINPTTGPVHCGPNAGSSSEKRCAVKPICANSPRLMPAASVRNLRSRQSSDPGSGRALFAETVSSAGAAPSGIDPVCSGVRDSTVLASSHTTTIKIRPMAAAATAHLSLAMAAAERRKDDPAGSCLSLKFGGNRARLGWRKYSRQDNPLI